MRSSCRRNQHGFGEFEDGDGMLTSHARELLEKMNQGIVSLEVINERLYGITRTREDGRTAQTIERRRDQRARQYRHEQSSPYRAHGKVPRISISRCRPNGTCMRRVRLQQSTDDTDVHG